MEGRKVGKFSLLSVIHSSVVFYLLCLVFTVNSAQKEALPEDDNALSLWLVSRTGWVYCERATEYMQEVDEEFNEKHCKQCYKDLFSSNRNHPGMVTDNDILKCARNFGAPGAYMLREPIRSNGVRAFTCNPEIMDTSFDFLGIREGMLFDTGRKFSPENDPKREYPRRSYIQCLLGKIYETEFALCTPNRRKCADERKKEAEEQIFSKSVPIRFKSRARNGTKSEPA